MNLVSESFRTTCIPQVNRLDTLSGSKKHKKMPHCIGIDMSGFKFNRDEINERLY
ncbi:MAG: hypothetical protein FWH22_04180 [Fibromonadales bacterium]|nr:hypothetical protein [Fibromonadales bacterium]